MRRDASEGSGRKRPRSENGTSALKDGKAQEAHGAKKSATLPSRKEKEASGVVRRRRGEGGGPRRRSGEERGGALLDDFGVLVEVLGRP